MGGAMTIDEIEKWAVSELKSQHRDVDWLESFGYHFRLVVRGACERAREPHTTSSMVDAIMDCNQRLIALTARVEEIELEHTLLVQQVAHLELFQSQSAIPHGTRFGASEPVAEAAARFGLGPTVGSKS